MANTFSRWIPHTRPFFDTEIKLKLRAFNPTEAPAFQEAVQARFKTVLKEEGETDEQHESRSERMLEQWKALCEDTFGKYVRVVEPVVNAEDPDETVTDGASLYRVAPGDFVLDVMVKLSELASLGDTAGKGSSSRSTSSVDRATPSSDCPVASTESGAGITLSTAQVGKVIAPSFGAA